MVVVTTLSQSSRAARKTIRGRIIRFRIVVIIIAIAAIAALVIVFRFDSVLRTLYGVYFDNGILDTRDYVNNPYRKNRHENNDFSNLGTLNPHHDYGIEDFGQIRLKALYRLERFEPLRGVRFLYEEYGLLLAVLPKVGNNPLQIVNIATAGEMASAKASATATGTDKVNKDYCESIPPISIWVRLSGQNEIVAGLAKQQHQKCVWEYHHAPLLPGNYTIDVKVLAVNDDGRDVLTDEQCHFRKNHTIKGGVKLLEFTGATDNYYQPDDACCDLCTKHPECTHFISTNKYDEEKQKIVVHSPVPVPHCILFSNKTNVAEPLRYVSTDKTENIALKRHVIGTTREDKAGATKFLGCGYSKTLEMDWCKSMGWDDVPYIISKTIFIASDIEKDHKNIGNDMRSSLADNVVVPQQTKKQQQLRNCPRTLDGATHGRWVKSSVSVSQCKKTSLNTENTFPTYLHEDSEPVDCWIFDKLIGHHCINGCERNPKSNIWKSHLITGFSNVDMNSNDKYKFFEYVWQPYTCNLPLYTNQMLAKCFIENDYGVPALNGDSIAGYLWEFHVHILSQINGMNRSAIATNITRPDTKQNNRVWGTRKVVLDNFSLLHLAWHNSDEQFNKILSNWSMHGPPSEPPPPTRNGNGAATADNGNVLIWFGPPFLSSERETHITQGRLNKFVSMARPILKKRGWIEVDWVNISMALSYESSNMYDGMHVLGNPMKTLFHMMMHALCG